MTLEMLCSHCKRWWSGRDVFFARIMEGLAPAADNKTIMTDPALSESPPHGVETNIGPSNHSAPTKIMLQESARVLGTEIGGLDTPISIEPVTGMSWRECLDAANLQHVIYLRILHGQRNAGHASWLRFRRARHRRLECTPRLRQIDIGQFLDCRDWKWLEENRDLAKKRNSPYS